MTDCPNARNLRTNGEIQIIYQCFPNTKSASGGNPFSMFLRVSDIMPRNCDTVFATAVVAGQRMVINLSLSLNILKFGIREDILPKKQFLLTVKV